VYCLLIFVLSVLSAVLSKSGKIADWNRWVISQHLRAIPSKNPDFMRVCGRTRLAETDRRNYVINRRRENSKSGSPHGLVGSNPTASAIGIPHKPCVYAVFPYPNKFYGRNKIPAVLLFSDYCYHDFQDNTAVKHSLLAMA
jgi:hypothetical protein